MATGTFQKYRFEELEVWRLAMEIIHESYMLTAKFPKDERFALVDQLKRASTSIALNIAEGGGQSSRKGFALYVNRAKSSVLECVACVKIALMEKFVEISQVSRLSALLQEEYFKLIALEKSLR